MYRNNHGNLSLYDRNSWQETSESLVYQQGMVRTVGEDFLMLEGYGELDSVISKSGFDWTEKSVAEKA